MPTKKCDQREEKVCFEFEKLIKRLRERADAERFVHKAVVSWTDDLVSSGREAETAEREAVAAITDPNLFELLVEQVYMETLIDSCKEKIEAATRRHETIKDRFKQLVCDRFDLPDDEPIKVDIERMLILRGNRELRIKKVKEQVDSILEADEDMLKEVIEREGKGTLEGDLAELILGSHREAAIKLCQEVFQATGEDREFLETLIDDEDVPKPIQYIARFVRKERGIACRKAKIIDWL